MSTNANDSAMPVFLQHGLSHDSYVDAGLTKREYFAAMAMKGILSNETLTKLIMNKVDIGKQADYLSNAAVEQADALIKALNQTN